VTAGGMARGRPLRAPGDGPPGLRRPSSAAPRGPFGEPGRRRGRPGPSQGACATTEAPPYVTNGALVIKPVPPRGMVTSGGGHSDGHCIW
jgi:hypothetical protein